MVKTIIVATIITCIVLISCANLMLASAEDFSHTYDRLAVVTDIEPTSNLMTFLDTQGNLWEFYDDVSRKIGDLCTLTIWNNSQDIARHEIIEIRSHGWINPDYFELLFHY